MNVDELIRQLEKFPGYRIVAIEVGGKAGVRRVEPTEVLEVQDQTRSTTPTVVIR